MHIIQRIFWIIIFMYLNLDMQHALNSVENRNETYDENDDENDDESINYNNTGDTIFDKKVFGLFLMAVIMGCFYHVMYRVCILGMTFREAFCRCRRNSQIEQEDENEPQKEEEEIEEKDKKDKNKEKNKEESEKEDEQKNENRQNFRAIVADNLHHTKHHVGVHSQLTVCSSMRKTHRRVP